MRQLSETFAARLAADETSLCACWRLERRDGAVFGATDHDRPIVFDDVTYQPATSLAGAALESDVSLAPGRAAVEGALDAEFITEADLAAGVWDGARADVWRVDWKAGEHRGRVWSGRLSEVKQAGQAFSAELVSLKADLERLVGRVYARACDAEVGDARCKVDLGGDAFRGEGEVTSIAGPTRIRVSGLSEFGYGWFAGGVVHWTSGGNEGLSSRVLRHAAGTVAEIELAGAPRFAVEAGDTFGITAGCDKAFATCGAKFANQDNFRGFPHMPGNDAVLSGPASDAPNDGRRRA